MVSTELHKRDLEIDRLKKEVAEYKRLEGAKVTQIRLMTAFSVLSGLAAVVGWLY